MSQSQENCMLVRRAVEEVYNQGRLETIDELVAGDIVMHMASNDLHGPAATRAYVAALRAAFPDLHVSIEDQFAEGDRVVTRWIARGTHLGAFEGIPPTGKQGSITGIDIDRFANGRVAECWTNMDDLGLLQQLGVIPMPEQVGA